MKSIGSLEITSLLLLWGGGTLFAFWHFEGQYLSPVNRPTGATTAHPETLPAPPIVALQTEQGSVSLTESQPVTVLNFWNPRCPCSQFAESDVRRLIETYGPKGVRFVTVIASGPTTDDQREASSAWQARCITGTMPVVDADNQLAHRFGVWAAPAAVILNTHGRIVYVGAYNAARYCHDPHTAWAAKALAAVVAGQTPPRAKALFFGCQLVGKAS